MKLVSTIVASLLGLMFVVFGLNFWLNFIPTPSPAAGTPAAAFMGAIYGSGYLAVVKGAEVLGGLLLLLPCSRRLGLTIISAVVFNIAVFHVAFFGWASLIPSMNNLPVIFSIVAVLFLVMSHRLFCCLAGCGCCDKDGSGCGSCCSKDSSESSASCSIDAPAKKSGGCGCG